MSPQRLDNVALRRTLALMSLPLVALVIAGAIGARDNRAPDATLRDLRTFSEVLQLTSRNYVDDLNVAQLERGAYQGLAESLDPWSSYYDPQRMAELTKGDRSGDVGLLLLKHPQQYVRVVVVVPGSPADAADIKRGQYIETIDDKATKDMTLLEAEAMLHGAPGSKVKLGFFRSTDEEAGKIIELTRKDLSALRVTERRIDASTALLRLTDLRPGTAELVRQRLDALRAAHVKDIVLDLRENVGGSPDEAVAVADLLAPAGPAFQRVTKLGAATVETKDADAWTGGLVVLVSRGTVGEAELLADALRRLEHATLVGQPTLGKTTQQDLVKLSGGVGLSMSIAEYRQPDGKEFDADGIQPDEKVARRTQATPAAEKSAGDAPAAGDNDNDQVEQALDDDPDAQKPAEGAVAPAKERDRDKDEDAQLRRALEILKNPPARKAA